MKTLLLFIVLAFEIFASAKITVTVHAPQTIGKKSIIKLTLKNDFSERVESARAQIFLIDGSGKVVGQKTAWVIGGTKDRPPLEPSKETIYNFVIEADKSFTKTKVSFSRIILEGGKMADVPKSFEVTP